MMSDRVSVSPRALLVGSTGRVGKRLISSLERMGGLQVVYASRNPEKVANWREDGKDAVFLDLDRPESFAAALRGIERVFLSTGYNVAMLHQSKNLIDAAVEAKVKFVVHLGIFGNGRITYSYGAWHELIERYIENSGMDWTHLHPHFFMDNLLEAAPVVNGTFHWFMGSQSVGWIAPEDVSAVAATVLLEGPQVHGSKQYWLATEMLNGEQVALKLTEALQVQVNSAILTPDDLEGGIASGAIKTAAYIEPTYAAGILEWVRQTYEGKLNFKGATTTVEELTGTAALSLVDWATRNREAILEAGTRLSRA